MKENKNKRYADELALFMAVRENKNTYALMPFDNIEEFIDK